MTLSFVPDRTLTIPVTATGQGGASTDDYGVPAEVTFNQGETTRAITFTAVADDEDDGGESVRLVFGTLPDGVARGVIIEATVDIEDLPPVEVSFGAASYTVAESDDAGTQDKQENEVTVTVTLNADPERSVTIPIIATAQGGADADDDYSGVPASVTFTSGGDLTATFTFSATADDVDDDGESVKLTFGPTLPPGVTAGTGHETVVSITDDDVPQVTVNFKSAAYTAAEGGTVDVEVTLDAAPERDLTIELTATGEDGAGAGDYTVPVEVTFGKEDTVKAITFTAAHDAVDDDGESVRLGFKTPPARRRHGGDRSRDGGLDHRRRRAPGHGELQVRRLHGGRGRHGRCRSHPGRGPPSGTSPSS